MPILEAHHWLRGFKSVLLEPFNTNKVYLKWGFFSCALAKESHTHPHKVRAKCKGAGEE